MRTYKRKNVVNECLEPIQGVLELCRLCLEEAKDSVPIFVNKNDICTALAARIMMCVGYEITHDECLPNAICTDCHKKLNKYYEFRKKCDNSYLKLKNHLRAVQQIRAKKLSIKQENQEANLLENTPNCSATQTVYHISQSDCPISQSDCSISQSDFPISQPVYPISQSVCSISQSACPVNQSVFTQSVSAVTQSVCIVTQPICTVSQSECAINQTVDQTDSTAGQICMASQTDSTVSKSDSTVVQAVYPVGLAVHTISQSVPPLVSHLVDMSRDQLILAFDKPLEIVQTELQQNGLDNTVNGWMGEAINNENVANIPQNPKHTEPMEVCPDVTEFLSTILIEMGILKRQQNELQITEECRTIQIETGDGEQITLELVPIEEEQTKTTTINKSRKAAKGKATNEVTKQKKDERPQCTECGRSFASRGVLKRHLRTHTGERPFSCASCGLSFTQREVLRRHVLVHQEVRPFPCSRCPKSFTQRGSLAAHERSHAPSTPRPTHQCTVCPKRFLHASGLSRHTKSHLGCVWTCDACGRRFSDDSALRRHTRLKHEPRHPPQEI